MRLIFFFMLILSISCNKSAQKEYAVVTVVSDKIERTVALSGRTEPANQATIMAPDDLVVLSLKANTGDLLKEKDLLCQLDASGILSSIKMEEDKLFQIQNQIKNSNIRFQGMRKNLERTNRLYRSGAVSLDEKERETQELSISENELKVLENSRKSLEAYLISLREKADLLDIRSPIEGIVTYVWTTPENFRPGQSIKKGDLLFRLASHGKMNFKATVREQDVIYFYPGQKLLVEFPFLKEERTEGIVKKVDNAATVDSNSGVATFKVTVEFDPPFKVKPGMEARVIYIIEKKDNILLIPKSTLNPLSGTSGEVIVFENGIKKRREVFLGVSNEINIEVISGLSEGEKVLAVYEE